MNAKNKYFRIFLKNFIKGYIFFDEPMHLHTSMCIGGNTDIIFFPTQYKNIIQVLKILKQNNIRYYIIGNGTNLIVSDKGYRGVIICLKYFKNVQILNPINSQEVKLKAFSGISLKHLLKLSLDNNISGLEFCVGIPGTLGGAIKMNAGAFGREIKDLILEIELLNNLGEIKNKKISELNFFYRNLDISKNEIIINSIIKLKKTRLFFLKKNIKKIIKLRKFSLYKNFPNSGSIFKNPSITISAGFLIDFCGLKGFRIGNAMVSQNHGNIIFNLGNATANDVIKLIYTIQTNVLNKTGIYLDPEVKIIGEF